jgi:hypothetical protein
MTAPEWNEKYAIGQSVIVWMDDNERRITTTRSTAWNLQGGQPVILLEGIAASYSLHRIRAVPKGTK